MLYKMKADILVCVCMCVFVHGYDTSVFNNWYVYAVDALHLYDKKYLNDSDLLS